MFIFQSLFYFTRQKCPVPSSLNAKELSAMIVTLLPVVWKSACRREHRLLGGLDRRRCTTLTNQTAESPYPCSKPDCQQNAKNTNDRRQDIEQFSRLRVLLEWA